ncbi:MAG: hypothetical protein RMJ19_14450 [Gemmatales bacterium]|nr:hypothetical protein [Gemmatales bacterium]MDW8176872.1 hypothetical protein [Gemmatales bacterium]
MAAPRSSPVLIFHADARLILWNRAIRHGARVSLVGGFLRRIAALRQGIGGIILGLPLVVYFVATSSLDYLHQGWHDPSLHRDELTTLEAELRRAEALMVQLRDARDRLICLEAEIVSAIRSLEQLQRKEHAGEESGLQGQSPGKASGQPHAPKMNSTKSLDNPHFIPPPPPRANLPHDPLNRSRERWLTEWRHQLERHAQLRQQLEAEHSRLAAKMAQCRLALKLLRNTPVASASHAPLDPGPELGELREIVHHLEQRIAVAQALARSRFSPSGISLPADEDPPEPE